MKKGGLFGGQTRGEEADQQQATEAASGEMAEDLDALDREMNELRAMYELYFMGVERTEPTVQADAVRSKLRKLRDSKPKNNALRFKLQMLQARMVSLQNYWGRVGREREAGTYFRDVQKVKKRQAELDKIEAQRRLKGAREPAATGSTAVDPSEGAAIRTGALKEGARSAAETAPLIPNRAPPGAAPSAVGRPSAQSADDLTEPKLKQLYQAYVTAKRRCGEKIDLRYEEMAATLKKQVPQLMESTGAKSIEFKVVIKANHAVLKAIPKKET